jgi:hypothetical protein
MKKQGKKILPKLYFSITTIDPRIMPIGQIKSFSSHKILNLGVCFNKRLSIAYCSKSFSGVTPGKELNLAGLICKV